MPTLNYYYSYPNKSIIKILRLYMTTAGRQFYFPLFLSLSLPFVVFFFRQFSSESFDCKIHSLGRQKFVLLEISALDETIRRTCWFSRIFLFLLKLDFCLCVCESCRSFCLRRHQWNSRFKHFKPSSKCQKRNLLRKFIEWEMIHAQTTTNDELESFFLFFFPE